MSSINNGSMAKAVGNQTVRITNMQERSLKVVAIAIDGLEGIDDIRIGQNVVDVFIEVVLVKKIVDDSEGVN